MNMKKEESLKDETNGAASRAKESRANVSFPNTFGCKVGIWIGGGIGLILMFFLKIYTFGSIAVVLWCFLWGGIGAAVGYGAEVFLKRRGAQALARHKK